MPAGNEFRHQVYSADPPGAPYELVRAEPLPPLDSDESRRRMRQVGERLRDADISAIYLVHGTFTGNDALGLFRELEWFVPQWTPPLRRQHKLLIDRFAGQSGNYTARFAHQFASLINGDAQNPIPVRLFYWSSENNHLGRADAAVRLLTELLERSQQRRCRFLLWGHSHAGNVFALMTNLLGGDSTSRRAYFRAGRPYYRWPVPGMVKVPAWPRLREQLADDPELPARIELDLATFGTPIRYGWETRGYRRLLHFIHHRPVPGLPDYRAAFPFSISDLLGARYGDYVQQLGIAGTNFPMSLLRWRYRRAEQRLLELLQPHLRWRDTPQRLRFGQRVPAEGDTLLIDYPSDEQHENQQLFGHAIYTRPEWLLMHAEEITHRMYDRPSRNGQD